MNASKVFVSAFRHFSKLPALVVGYICGTVINVFLKLLQTVIKGCDYTKIVMVNCRPSLSTPYENDSGEFAGTFNSISTQFNV